MDLSALLIVGNQDFGAAFAVVLLLQNFSFPKLLQALMKAVAISLKSTRYRLQMLLKTRGTFSSKVRPSNLELLVLGLGVLGVG